MVYCDSSGLDELIDTLTNLRESPDIGHIHMQAPSAGGKMLNDQNPWGEPAIIEVNLESYINVTATNRIAISLTFEGVESISQIADIQKLEQNSFAGNINYWLPEQSGGTTYIYLTDGCIAITSEKLELKY